MVVRVIKGAPGTSTFFPNQRIVLVLRRLLSRHFVCFFFILNHNFLYSVSQQEEVSNILRDTLQSIKLSDRGVYVQASTLGSLEALLEFLRTSKIPVSNYSATLWP